MYVIPCVLLLAGIPLPLDQAAHPVHVTPLTLRGRVHLDLEFLVRDPIVEQTPLPFVLLRKVQVLGGHGLLELACIEVVRDVQDEGSVRL